MQISDDELMELVRLVASKKMIEQISGELNTVPDDVFISGYLAGMSMFVTYIQMVTESKKKNIVYPPKTVQ